MLGNQLRGLSNSDLGRVARSAFNVLKEVDWPSAGQIKALAERAEQVFGDVRTWDVNQWRDFGKLAGSFALEHLSKLESADLNKLQRVWLSGKQVADSHSGGIPL